MQKLPIVNYQLPAIRQDWNGLFLVGEAPGAEEVKQGRPFVGRSGQLLNEVLAKAGIDRARCCVANAFRMQPPGNKIGHFFMSRRAAAREGVALDASLGLFAGQLCRAEFAGELHALTETLKSWKPSVVVALGRTALWALTGENGLMDKIGTRQACRLTTEPVVIPTYHPSYILRGNWGLVEAWGEHIRMAMQAVAGK